MATRDRDVTSLTLDRHIMLLRSWERCFTIISSAWRILTSSKFLQDKTQRNRNYGTGNLPTGSGLLVLCTTSPPFSREWRIKMELTN